MTKAIDNRNATARKKVLEMKEPRPYYKLFLDTKYACPYCNQFLKPRAAELGGYECPCSTWAADWLSPGDGWKRLEK